MASVLIAVKLGSSTTTIYRQGDGLVLREPSLIAARGTGKNREVLAVGYEAESLAGRTDDDIQVVSPIVEGTVNNAELATLMLRGFVHKVCPARLFRPSIRALVCLPIGATAAQQKDMQKICYQAGISDVMFLPAIVCTAIGLGLDIGSSFGKLVVNLGGGCTNIAVIANNNIINGITVSIGGTKLNTAIEKYILEKYNLIIGSGVAERIKQEVASLFPTYSATTSVDGVSADSRTTRSIAISSAEIYPIMDQYYSKICQAILSVVNSCSPDIISDIFKEGGYFCGSQTTYPGVDRYLKGKLNMQVHLSEISKTDIWGAGKLLDDPVMLKKLLTNN